MSIIHSSLLLGAGAAAGGYQIERSLRFNSSDSASLSRASYAGSGTFSCWVKRCKLGTAQTIISGVAFDASDQLNSSTAVFRDPSAWMHVLVSTSGTYVNGTSVASGSAITPGIIGSGCDLYLADIHFIDGQALAPSSFAETNATTGQWVPKAYTGSYGTNGFRLTFSDNSGTTSTTLGKDAAGSNNWTPNNFSVASGSGNDSLVDSPTSFGTNTGAGGEVRGNYATWNPLDKNASFNAANGNLDANASAGVNGNIRGTIGVSSGKWYWEYLINNTSPAVGIATAAATLADFPGVDASGYSYTSGGQKWNSNSGSSYGATYTTNDIIGVALDLDAGTLVFYKNGVSQGTAYSGLPVGTYFPAGGRFSGTFDVTLNAGARPFAYTAPSGFKALCDTNLTAPVVAKPNTVMDVALWSGTGATQSITFQSGLSPDFVWIKARNDVANHVAFDVIRGANKAIYPSLTNAEDTYTATLTSFNSSGFTLGYDDWSGVNASGRTYVGWCWDAGSSTVTNTQGSITSSVRANASAGFSIVTYTGTGTANSTFGHGLGVAPALIITKNRGSANDWYIYHSSLGVSSYLSLNTTGAAGTLSNYWSPVNSTVFGQTYTSAGPNNGSQVAYCFAPVTGYSSGFSYTGNGSTDGVFVYLGLRAKLLLIKRTDTTGNWYLWDTVRNTYNVVGEELYPNLSNAAATATDLDILSNGFKMRSTAADFNASGGTYVGFAWAETPFVYSRAR